MSETTAINGNNVTPRKIIVKPRSIPFTFASRVSLTNDVSAPRTLVYNKIRPILSKPSQPSTSTNSANDDEPVPKVYSKFASKAMIVVNKDAGEKPKNIIVPQTTGGITRMPIMINRPNINEPNKSKLPGTTPKRQKNRSKSPFDKPKSLDFNIQIATESVDLNPKLAITSEPLLLHYQEIMGVYKRQVRDLQNEIKNYRRREDQLKKKSKGPQIIPLCRKSFSTSSGSLKRKIVKQLRDAVDILLKDCSPEDKKAALTKAFPETFEQGNSQSKLDTEQTWMFERKFKLNNGIMDRYRRFLNQYNANPFVSRRQINNHKIELEKINPALLNIQPADDSSPPNSDEEMDEESYVPNFTRAAQTNNNRRQHITAGVTTTVIRSELYSPNSTAAVQYGQQLIQQEQYLRRLQTSQSYNAARQNQTNAQQEQYGSLPRQPQNQTTAPSAFQPANSTYSNYTSLYNGHY